MSCQVLNDLDLTLHELFPIDKSFKLVKKGTTTDPVSLNIMIKGAEIKYLPEKYSKLTLTLPESALLILREFQTQIKKDIGCEDFLKDSTISLKLSDNIKELTKSLSRGDHLNFVMKFGDVWTINKKKYASWSLVQFKKVSAPEPVEIYNLD